MKRVILFLVLGLSISVWAAKEIRINYDSGSTLYAVIRDTSDNDAWDKEANGWETWDDGSIADYNVPLNDRSGDYYEVDFDTDITTAGTYNVGIYLQAGAGPAVSDTLVGSGDIIWDGSAEVTLANLVRSTTPANKLDVSAGGEAGIDWANVGSKTTTVALTNTTVGTVSTLTGHTVQTGDSYAIVNNGTYGNSALNTDIDAILADSNELQTDWSNGGRLDLLLDATLADTAELQAALSGWLSDLDDIKGNTGLSR